MLLQEPKFTWENPQYQTWEAFFCVVGQDLTKDSQCIQSIAIGPGSSQEQKVSPCCWRQRALQKQLRCPRVGADVSASTLSPSFHSSRRLYTNFQGREATNSPTQLWHLLTKTVTSVNSTRSKSHQGAEHLANKPGPVTSQTLEETYPYYTKAGEGDCRKAQPIRM